MGKNELFTYALIPDFSEEIAVPVLTQEPYTDMAIVFNRVDIFEHGMRFEYQVICNPNNIDYQDDILFHKYLERVLETIIKTGYSHAKLEENLS